MTAAVDRWPGHARPLRSWSSVLAVQLHARVEVLRSLAAALGDLSSATQPHEDLELRLVEGLVAVLEDVARAQTSVEAQLDAMVTSRARAAEVSS